MKKYKYIILCYLIFLTLFLIMELGIALIFHYKMSIGSLLIGIVLLCTFGHGLLELQPLLKKIIYQRVIMDYPKFNWLAVPKFSVPLAGSILYGTLFSLAVSALISIKMINYFIFPLLTLILLTLFLRRNSSILKIGNEYYISSLSGITQFYKLSENDTRIEEDIFKQEIRYEVIHKEKLIFKIDPHEFSSLGIEKIKEFITCGKFNVLESNDMVHTLDPCRYWTRKN